MDVRSRWILIGTGTLCALAAIAALPPRSCDAEGRSLIGDAICQSSYPGGAPHAALVNRTRDRLGQAILRRRLVDSLATTPALRRVTDGAITVYYEPPVSADSARRWLAIAQRELAMLPGAGGGAATVVVLRSEASDVVASKLPAPDGQNWWYRPRLDRFATTAHGGTCVVVLDLARGPFRALQQGRPVLLDWCALYARYGMPGRGVERWAASAFSFGWRDNASIAELVTSPPFTSFPPDFRVLACQSGAAAACSQYVNALGFQRDRWATRDNARILLAWLVATGRGGEFGRFWTAEGTVPDAIGKGFGRPAADVLQAWMQQRFTHARARPLGAPKVLLAGALWLTIAMAAAFVAMQRRQVG